MYVTFANCISRTSTVLWGGSFDCSYAREQLAPTICGITTEGIALNFFLGITSLKMSSVYFTDASLQTFAAASLKRTESDRALCQP